MQICELVNSGSTTKEKPSRELLCKLKLRHIVQLLMSLKNHYIFGCEIDKSQKLGVTNQLTEKSLFNM